MPGHVFVDESKRRDFVLVAAAVVPAALEPCRQHVLGLRLPGQQAIHMVKESAGRQRTILRSIAELDLSVTVYVARKHQHKTEGLAWRRCLEVLLDDISAAGHDKAASEPMLVIPDAVAWAWPQQGAWRALCLPVVTEVKEV